MKAVARLPPKTTGNGLLFLFGGTIARAPRHEVQLYAFDCLAYNGDDLTRLPLQIRKLNLMQLLRGPEPGDLCGTLRAG